MALKSATSYELEAVANVVRGQPENYGKDFDVMVTHLGQMVIKKGYNTQPVHILKTRCQPLKSKVALSMGKIEHNKYTKAIWNSIYREHQMQVRKLQE